MGRPRTIPLPNAHQQLGCMERIATVECYGNRMNINFCGFPTCDLLSDLYCPMHVATNQMWMLCIKSDYINLKRIQPLICIRCGSSSQKRTSYWISKYSLHLSLLRFLQKSSVVKKVFWYMHTVRYAQIHKA